MNKARRLPCVPFDDDDMVVRQGMSQDRLRSFQISYLSDETPSPIETARMAGKRAAGLRPRARAAGTSITQSAMADYVVMRFAGLLDERLVRTAVDHALAAHSGNGGCRALEAASERLLAIAR